MADHQTSLHDIDMLIQVHDAQQDRLDKLLAVARAEHVVAMARHADLVAARKQADERHAAAEALLTKGRKDGSEANIAAATAYEARAAAVARWTSHACRLETQEILIAAVDMVQQVSGQIAAATAARAAVIEALRAYQTQLDPRARLDSLREGG
jgi:hypothetical protein